MKLKKAIEILGRECGQSSGLTLKEILDAEKLGLEALKAIQATRIVLKIGTFSPLPGETDD